MERAFKGIWIPKEVWLDTNLTWVEKILIVEIDSLDKENGCFASNAYFADFFNLSKNRISKIISSLASKEYITTRTVYRPNTKIVEKRVIKVTKDYRQKLQTPIGKKDDTLLAKTPHPIGGNANTLLAETPHPIGGNDKDNNTNNNTVNNKDNKTLSSKDEKIPYKEIIDYLNHATGRNYRNVEAHRKVIKARWNEGNKFEAFKKVIDIKTADWLTNETYSQYLQPSTLFGPKFDNYLNQVVRQPKIAPGANGVKYRGGKGYGGIEF